MTTLQIKGTGLPVLGSNAPNLIPKRDKHTIVRAFKAHSDYHLSDDVIEAYATTFYHGGKFVLVRTEAERAGQLMGVPQGFWRYAGESA